MGFAFKHSNSTGLTPYSNFYDYGYMCSQVGRKGGLCRRTIKDLSTKGTPQHPANGED